jgi:hypothetical protein
VTAAELAEASGLSEGNVRRRLRRGETEEGIIRWGAESARAEAEIFLDHLPLLLAAFEDYYRATGWPGLPRTRWDGDVTGGSPVS